MISILPFDIMNLDRDSFANLLDFIIGHIGVKGVLYSEPVQMKGPISIAEQPRIDFVISGEKHLQHGQGGVVTDVFMPQGTAHYNTPMTPKIAVWDSPHEMSGLVFYREFLRVTYIHLPEPLDDPLTLISAPCWYHTHYLPDDAIRQCCRLLNHCEGTPKWAMLSREMVMSLLKLAQYEVKNDTKQNLTKKELTWIRILTYLQENFTRHVGREQIAKELQLCPGYLSELVVEKTGESFSRLLRTLRMEHAAKLLVETNYPLKEITWLCGYQSLTFFCAAFREHFGKTPNEYRLTN